MKLYSRIILLIILLISINPNKTFSQEKEKKPWLDVNASLYSRYVWRGQLMSQSPNIQPSITFDPQIGLTLQAWGSYSFNGDLAEVDLYLKYGIKGFSVQIADYFIADEAAEFGNYFKYAAGKTFHTFEATLGYEGPEKVPLYFTASTMFFGDDRKVKQMIIDTVALDTTYTYTNRYSTYFELGYTYKDFTIFAGLTPFASFYGKSWGVVNTGLTYRKWFLFQNNFSLGLEGSLIFNPQKQHVYLVFGLSI